MKSGIYFFCPKVCRVTGFLIGSERWYRSTSMSLSLSSQVVQFLVNSKMVYPLFSSPLTKNQSWLGSMGGRACWKAKRSCMYTRCSAVDRLVKTRRYFVPLAVCTGTFEHTIDQHFPWHAQWSPSCCKLTCILPIVSPLLISFQHLRCIYIVIRDGGSKLRMVGWPHKNCS